MTHDWAGKVWSFSLSSCMIDAFSGAMIAMEVGTVTVNFCESTVWPLTELALATIRSPARAILNFNMVVPFRERVGGAFSAVVAGPLRTTLLHQDERDQLRVDTKRYVDPEPGQLIHH